MREAQVLIDVTVASAMLMFRVAPLPTFPPLVVRRAAEHHGLWRRRADAIAGDATARSSLVQSSFPEQTRQRHAKLLVYGEVAAEKPDLSVLAVVSVHGTVSVLFVVGRYLVHRAAVHVPPVVAANLDSLAAVPLRLLLVATTVWAATVLAVRRRRHRGLAGTQGPALQQPLSKALGLLHGSRRVGYRLRNIMGPGAALRHRGRRRGYTLHPHHRRIPRHVALIVTRRRSLGLLHLCDPIQRLTLP